jgi:hypothetical protein
MRSPSARLTISCDEAHNAETARRPVDCSGCAALCWPSVRRKHGLAAARSILPELCESLQRGTYLFFLETQKHTESGDCSRWIGFEHTPQSVRSCYGCGSGTVRDPSRSLCFALILRTVYASADTAPCSCSPHRRTLVGGLYFVPIALEILLSLVAPTS